jgi:hypothetical protein
LEDASIEPPCARVRRARVAFHGIRYYRHDTNLASSRIILTPSSGPGST